MVVTLFVVSLVVFLVIHLIPGGPANAILGQQATEERVNEVRQELNLDEPLHIQYLDYYGGILFEGDFGKSLTTGNEVAPMLVNRITTTLTLAVLGLSFAVLMGVPAGVISGLKQNSTIDEVLTLVSFAGVSTPPFWLAIMLIFVFGLWLGWFPTYGYVSPYDQPIQGLKTLVLPTLSIGVIYAAVIMRFVRTEIIENKREEYITTLRSKGLTNRSIYLQLVRNSLMPAVTIVGLSIGRLLGAAVIIEVVYAIPGSGSALFNAIISRDYPIIQGFVLVIALVYMLMNLATDIVYTYLDPRIEY